MRKAIHSINITLKMFILSICLLNFTACSAKSKTHETEDITHKVKYANAALDVSTNVVSSSVSNSTTAHSELEIKDHLKVQDSVKNTATRNNKAVKKRELIIDSIISTEAKIFGLRMYERSSDVGNEDTETKWYGSFDNDKSSNSNDGMSYETLNTDFTQNDQIKAKSKKSEDSSNTSRSRQSTETRGWFLIMITNLVSSGWFWILVILATISTWCYLKGVNPIIAIKTLFNKLRINGGNTDQ